MAIHQDRMLTLLNAAIDYKCGLEDLCQFIQHQLAEYHANNCTAADALAVISHAANIKFALRHPDSTPSVIAIEYYHYETHHKSNDRARIRAERKRRERGATSRRQREHPFLTDKLVKFDRFNPKTIARAMPAYLTASVRAQIDEEAKEALRDISTPVPPAPPATNEDEYDDDMLAELAIAQGKSQP